MFKRKPTAPALIVSLVIHATLLLLMWGFVAEEPPLVPFYDAIAVTITHVVRPPLPIKQVPVVEPPVPVEEQKPPPPPKPPRPKPELNATWELETPVSRREQETAPREHGVGDGLSHLTPVSAKPAESGVRVNALTAPSIALPTASETAVVAPQGETAAISLETDADLSGRGSPNVDAPNIHYGSERGDALRATGVGNSWGGGSTTGSANVGGEFVYMMKAVAQTLATATETEKVDVVFVLDETASMTDNIRGIRAYVDFLFEAFARDGRDATFGLVTFTDQTRKYGRTADLGTFKNWLFKIGVDGGGDIAEAGLDALMTAVTETDFRTGAQRLILLASDGAFHDADYDGKSVHSLDSVIETLQAAKVRVDVIGIDYLPIRQIALATGGTWRAIPGRGYLEYIPPLTLTVKLFSKLGTLNLENGQMDDRITVHINNPPRPKRLTLTWKVLNPLGERCYGPIREQKVIPDDGTTTVELMPALDPNVFRGGSGVYTIIYRLENEHGHRSILRRTLTL